MKQRIIEKVRSAGASAWGIIPTADIPFSEEVRKICEGNMCHGYGESLERPFLLLSNEGCIRCKSCTYPDAPCRFPDKLYPSLEGYGILVTELAKKAGLNFTTAARIR